LQTDMGSNVPKSDGDDTGKDSIDDGEGEG